MKGRRSIRESGFTLLEVLITLAILAVGVTLTLSLISGALANIRKVQVRARTIQHAETVMELTLLDDSISRPTTLNGDFVPLEDAAKIGAVGQVDFLRRPADQVFKHPEKQHSQAHDSNDNLQSNRRLRAVRRCVGDR